MKIICDNCRTKYSIADEKVKGKVFKIRCKKCQNIIVVRGNQEDPEAPAADGPAAGEQVGPAAGETPVWHLVIGRDQVGPMTPAEVRNRFSSGEINTDTYIWREGFTDWVRITTVEEFANLGQGQAEAPEAGVANQAAAQWDPATREPEAPAGQPAWEANAGADAEAAWSASAADPGASWQGGGGDAPAEGLAANQPASRGGRQDLFSFGGGHSEGSAAGGAEPRFSQTPQAQNDTASQGLFQSPASGGSDIFGGGSNGGQQLFPSEDEQPSIQMKGARHENSVLFSLSNLQALAMGGKSSAPSPSPSSSSLSSAEGRVGGSGMDGSGLIDIRSMASPAAAAPMSSGGMDDLPDLGGYSAPIAAAPVLMPAIADERPKWLLPTIIGVGGALVVSIIVLVLVLVLKEDKPPMVADSTQVAGAALPAVGAPVAPGVATAATAATEAKGEDVAAAGSEAGKGEEEDEAQAKAQVARRQAARRPGGRRVAAQGRVSEAASAPETRRTAARSGGAAAKPKKAGGDELDALIDSAIHGEGPKKTAKPTVRQAAAPDANLPETLSRGQIQGGMQNIKASVQGCYDRFRVPGLALTHVVIGQNGRIGSVRVKGVFAGTPTGACVASAVKSASFPKFKGQPISIEYPFQLR